MKKFDVTILTVSVLILGLVGIGFTQAKGAPTDSTGSIVGKVGNLNITQNQVYEEMKGNVGKDAMTNVIATELFKLESKAQGITVSEKELDDVINEVKEKTKTPEKFQAYLEDRGMDEQGLRDKTKLIMLRDKLVEKAFPVTDEQIKEYYEKNKDKLDISSLEEGRKEITEKVKEKNRRKNSVLWMEEMTKKYQVQIFDPALDYTIEQK